MSSTYTDRNTPFWRCTLKHSQEVLSPVHIPSRPFRTVFPTAVLLMGADSNSYQAVPRSLGFCPTNLLADGNRGSRIHNVLILRPLLVPRILVGWRWRPAHSPPPLATLKNPCSVNTAYEPESSFTTSRPSTTRPFAFMELRFQFRVLHIAEVHERRKWTVFAFFWCLLNDLLLTFFPSLAGNFSHFSHSLRAAAFAPGTVIVWGHGTRLCARACDDSTTWTLFQPCDLHDLCGESFLMRFLCTSAGFKNACTKMLELHVIRIDMMNSSQISSTVELRLLCRSPATSKSWKKTPSALWCSVSHTTTLSCNHSWHGCEILVWPRVPHKFRSALAIALTKKFEKKKKTHGTSDLPMRTRYKHFGTMWERTFDNSPTVSQFLFFERVVDARWGNFVQVLDSHFLPTRSTFSPTSSHVWPCRETKRPTFFRWISINQMDCIPSRILFLLGSIWKGDGKHHHTGNVPRSLSLSYRPFPCLSSRA